MIGEKMGRELSYEASYQNPYPVFFLFFFTPCLSNIFIFFIQIKIKIFSKIRA